MEEIIKFIFKKISVNPFKKDPRRSGFRCICDYLRKRNLRSYAFTLLEIYGKLFRGKQKRQGRFLSLTGFTLTEILFVVILIAVLMAAIYPYLRVTHRGWQTVDRRQEIIQNARVGLDKMTRMLSSLE